MLPVKNSMRIHCNETCTVFYSMKFCSRSFVKTSFHWMKQTTWNWRDHFHEEGQLEVLLNNYTENRADYLGGHWLLNSICATTHKIKFFHRVVHPEESEPMAPVHHLFRHLRKVFV